eukprot:3015315-Amphidinium_carterae.1
MWRFDVMRKPHEDVACGRGTVQPLNRSQVLKTYPQGAWSGWDRSREALNRMGKMEKAVSSRALAQAL